MERLISLALGKRKPKPRLDRHWFARLRLCACPRCLPTANGQPQSGQALSKNAFFHL
jgi:hypothetical protein